MTVAPEPYAYYAALRAETPVCHQAGADVWLVSGYRDVMTVLRDCRRFSAFALGLGQHEITSPEDGRVLRVGETLLTADPPLHTRLRRFIEPAFGRQQLTRYERTTRVAVYDVISQIRLLGRCDVISEVAQPVAAAVLTELLGGGEHSLAAADVWRWMRIYSACNARIPTQDTATALRRAQGEIWEAICGAASADTQTGLMASLARAHAQGEVSAARAVDLCGTVVQGSADTTSHLVSYALLTIHQRPDIHAALRANPDHIPDFVEECLRCEAPVQMTMRCTNEAVELSGTRIPAGARVLVLIGAANRDHGVFERAETFDPHRQSSRHMSFGAGAHHCPGASLARSQVRTILEALLGELEELGVDLESMVLAEAAALRGAERLEITFAPREHSVRR